MASIPAQLAAIPRVPLLFPTPPPIESLGRLSAHLTDGGNNTSTKIFVKREDANSGLGGGGGNKLRKLEYVLADALAQQPRPSRIVTEGGVQSNHVRQVAAAAAKLGFEATLLINDLVRDRSGAADRHVSESYNELGNVQLTHLMSATHAAGKDKQEILQKDPESYWIPSGASTHPLGGLGYARWAFEIEQQEAEMGVHFDVVVVALMSGSTLGGMVAGFKLADQERANRGETSQPRRLIGVLAGPKSIKDMETLVLGIANSTADKIGVSKGHIVADDFVIDDRWHGGGYGQLDKKTKDGIKLAATKEGLVTDPVYSGKALTGLCEMVRQGEVQGNVLFVHTGGIMSLSAYPDLR
ncbi:1-aminocyclopropane-1-carboxylate deaminase [Microdochium trichocladiopsis]|uniref:1-aminocyclopropane-1-carboxylate deaminase n=1 Tax=Microdochium trichocladiopsis TaxID=1682393 RepID=A0A9P9BP04_9PEZI|nr:1-aminocyclopropane-1-carboxylate deaminase [Microdochium trichocladiopsis]KAH7028779.1 1-aminocyclopropane-1-carboxylate deaminase [Microdochium trichocladiopsis]